MGGAVKSAGGFLGLSDGDKAPDGNFANSALGILNGQNSLYQDGGQMGDLAGYLGGSKSTADILKNVGGEGLSGGGAEGSELANALATGPLTGTKFATEQVQNSPLFGQLFGQGGALSSALGKEQELQNQGFKLQPQDIEAYGQASGDIARMFGQSENNMAQSLASRGLAASPSGAAGAMFSGLQGNKNEQLAQAQTDIANKRMQNTMQRIGQQQQFAAQLGGQAQNAVQNQFNNQLQGVQLQKGALGQAGGLQQATNNSANAYGLQKSAFDAANKPANFMDSLAAGAGSQMYDASSGNTGKQLANTAVGSVGGAASKGAMA